MKKLSVPAVACAFLTLVSGAAWASGDAAAGQELAIDCAGCHGDDGKGDEDFPGITGMSEEDFMKAMKEYADGTRANKQMARAAKKLSDQELADLAVYYASR